jgi:hypothetical protein
MAAMSSPHPTAVFACWEIERMPGLRLASADLHAPLALVLRTSYLSDAPPLYRAQEQPAPYIGRRVIPASSAFWSMAATWLSLAVMIESHRLV